MAISIDITDNKTLPPGDPKKRPITQPRAPEPIQFDIGSSSAISETQLYANHKKNKGLDWTQRLQLHFEGAASKSFHLQKKTGPVSSSKVITW